MTHHFRMKVAAAFGFGLCSVAGFALIVPPTISNNVLPSTPVGSSETVTVKLVLVVPEAIKSIALAAGASSEYSIVSKSGCTMDGVTVNPAGTECDVVVKFTPAKPGSTAAPNLSRNATLLFTDPSASSAFGYGLAGAASAPISHVTPGTMTVFAGAQLTGTNSLDNGLGYVAPSSGGDNGPATSAGFALWGGLIVTATQNLPQPLAMDSAGNIYVADAANFVIRKIDSTPSHIITTIAGIAKSSGFSGDGGLATSAKLSMPHGITLDRAGNIYFLDNGGPAYSSYAGVVRRIDAVTGIITSVVGENYVYTSGYNTAAGGGTCPGGGNSDNCGDGGLASYAYVAGPTNLAIDDAGNFYLMDSKSYLRKVSASTGIITTIDTPAQAGLLMAEGGMTIAADGNLYILGINTADTGFIVSEVNLTTNAVSTVAGGGLPTSSTCSVTGNQTGQPATSIYITQAQLQGADLSSDASGNLYVVGAICYSTGYGGGYPAVFRVNLAAGMAYLEAVGQGNGLGSSGQATSGYNAFYQYYVYPFASIPDNAGNLYIESYNQIVLLSGSSAAYDFPIQRDFTSSTASIVEYANVGNTGGSIPSTNFLTGTNFAVPTSGDAAACSLMESVLGGASCNIDIVFTPIAPGTVSDTLNVAAGGATDTVALTGIGLAEPLFAITPATLAFGNVTDLTTSAAQFFTLSNPGTASLPLSTIYVTYPGNAEFAISSGGTCPAGGSGTLAAGASCTVAITFTPPTAAASTNYTASLYVSDSLGFGNVATITGTGTPAVSSPTASVSPNPLAFGSVGAVATQNVVVSNSGTSPLTVSNIAIAGSAFTIGTAASNNCTVGIVIAAAGSCNVAVTLTAAHPGTFSGTLTLTDNSGGTAGAIQTVPLSGYENGIYLTASPAALSFGNQAVGTTSASQAVTITNNGYGYSATVSSPTNYAPFNVSLGTCTSALAVGQSCQLNVTFSPTTATVYTNSTLSVVGTGPPAPTNTVSFSASGTGTGLPAFVFNPNAIQFGNQTVNTTSNVFTSQITNTGTATLNISSVTLTGANPTAFTIVTSATNPCGTTLAVNASCNYSVTFAPTAATPYSASLTVASDTTASPQSLPLSGTGTAPLSAVVTLTPNPLAFPGTAVGAASNAPTQLSLTNSGTGPLTISAITITGANASSFSQTNLCPASLAAGSSCGITVLFTPTAAGALTANVSVADNATGSPQLAVLTGTGLVPQVSLTPNPLVFGSQQVNTSAAPLSVTLTNTGGATLHIASTLLAGANSGDFNETSTCSTQVTAGTSCTFSFTFTPLNTGSRTATLTINDDAPGSPQTITVNGTATAAPAPQAVLTASAAFPNTTVGTTATGQTLTLSNPGNATLQIASIVIAGANPSDFSQTNTCGTSLAASASCTINLSFTPASAVGYAATVLVSDNVQPQQTATITGTGVPAATPTPVLGPSQLTFPSTTVGSSSTPLPITLTNSGTAALAISSIAVTGTNATSFTQTNTCGSSLAAGATCTISVTFSPGTAATLTASVTVTDNASTPTQSVVVTGVGTAVPTPAASLSPNPLSFPSTTVGSSSAALPVMLTNSGTAALTIGSIAVTGANASSFTQSNTCGSSLAAGATCAISVVFTPATAAALTASITVTDNAASATQTVTLTGTGTAAPVAGAALSPNPLAFPSTTVGTSSAALPMTLTNSGTAALTISGVAITGANASSFTQTNTCGASVAAGASCTINVTFTPSSATGGLTANITVTDNAAGSPQSAVVTGTGVASVATTFTVAASTPSVSVVPGGLAQYNLTVAPLGGSYNNVVTLSASGLPSGAVATFAPPAVTPGSGGAPSVLSIQTSALSAALRSSEPPGRRSAPMLALLAGLPLLGLAAARRRYRAASRRWMLVTLAALATLPVLAMSGCSGGYFGQTAKTYTVTVTGTSGALQQSTTISLTVQ